MKDFNRKLLKPVLISLLTTLIILLGSIIILKHPISVAREANLPQQYVGVWEGQGTQENGIAWSILIALIPGPQGSIVGTIAYPSIPCSGKLSFQGNSNNQIKLSETLTNTGVCASGGAIALSPTTSNQLNFRWFHPDGREDGTGSVDRISANL